MGKVRTKVSPKRVAMAVIAFVALASMALVLVSGVLRTSSTGQRQAAGPLVTSTDGASGRPGDAAVSPSGPADPTERANPPERADLPGQDETDPEPTEPPPDVLAPAGPGAQPDPAAVAHRIGEVSRAGVGGVYSASVVDVGTGTSLFGHRAGAVEIPASVNKLLTSAAVLAELGPEHRFTTKVVAAGQGKIVLVGGGDPYLARKATPKAYPARASIAGLAAETAAALKKAKTPSVALGYDATLFTGPAWNPTWPTGYANQVTRTSALWVDEGRLAGGSPGPRAGDPAGQAAKSFAAALRKRGIKVSSVRAAKAESGAATLAAVSSMPLDRIVERVLMSSDNDSAEVLFRQVAVAAGRGGSVSQARKQIEATLTGLGAWSSDTVVYDGSGLSRDNRVEAKSLSRLLQLAAQDKHPELRGLITGLPVAGVEGSLEHRFYSDDARAARGRVRGKTGTLRQVYSLAGVVRTSDGTLVAYAFITNRATGEYAAKRWLDNVTAAIAACGCQG